MGFWSSLASFCCRAVTPDPPPANSVMGFRWVAGQGVPNQLDVYDFQAGAGSGIFVVFRPDLLLTFVDVFERGFGGPGPLFNPSPAAPAPPSQAMTDLIARMRANPPAGTAGAFNNVTQARLGDMTGYLAYVATCLEIINHTAVGAQLMIALNAAPVSVFIQPASSPNNQTAAGGAFLNTLAEALSRYFDGQPLPAAMIADLVNKQYAAVNGAPARFDQFAADLNTLPLCSLFVADNAFQPNFLHNHFNFRGQPITGQNLMNWISPDGLAVLDDQERLAFDNNVRTFGGVYENVRVRDFFLLAIILVLQDVATPTTPANSGIMFHVNNAENNVIGAPDYRPPAIGLAHELMHALHYGRGTGPGRYLDHFTTTAAELLFTGLRPFAAEPISENAVRAQWATIPGAALDPSNGSLVPWVPARRDAYEPPPQGQTPTTMRVAGRSI